MQVFSKGVRHKDAKLLNIFENTANSLRLLYVALHNNWDEVGGIDRLAILQREPTHFNPATQDVEEVRY